VTERMERILVEALQGPRPVLVNPTEDDLRKKAEELRHAGKLTCTYCRKPVHDPAFVTQRLQFGPRLQAVAHLHPDCAGPFTVAMAEARAAAAPASSES
jgi:hypothetical protein